MTYDPKKRPVYFGPPHLRNKRTLNEGFMNVADSNENKIEPVNKSGLEKALDIGKVVALVLVSIAAALITAAASGAPIPGSVLGVASVVIALGSALGIASPGLQPKPKSDLKAGEKGPPAE